MRKTDNSAKRILYPLFFLLLAACLLFAIFRHTSPAGKVKVNTYRVPDGWGYRIVMNGKVYIDQPFIPVIPGRKAFPDKRSASRTGRLVKQKLIHRQLPTLTMEDLSELGLDSLLFINE